jgi:transcription initiation factor IIE alpha subunit
LPIKTWKTQPVHFVLLEILKKKGGMTDDELFEELSEEFKDLGFKDFNRLLMCLEIGGKVRVTSMTRGKRRVEILT